MFNERFLVFLTVVTVAFCLAYCGVFLHSTGVVLLPDKQLLNVNKTERYARLLEYLRRSSYLKTQQFEMTGHDVMVFLHIQKTGGTSFGKSLVKHLHGPEQRTCDKVVKLKKIEKARYVCKRPNSSKEEFWLYSRYSTGWVCGLHADWTTWTSCLPNLLKSKLSHEDFNKIKWYYVTTLRDPVGRFLSELKHIQRGATWKTSIYICGNRKYKLPLCYNGANWSSVTLAEFLACPNNLAFNRQTRMLANLTEAGCYNNNTDLKFPRNRDHAKAMLKSAKKTLRTMAYFGLMEYQKESQYLFEKTFGLKFKKNLYQVPVSETISSDAWQTLSPKFLLQIRETNRLDRQLYSYAKALFFKRLKYLERLNTTFHLT